MAAAMLASPITWMVAGITALALAVEDLVVWAEGGESAFDGLWTAIFGSPDEAIAAFDALQKKIEECSENADVNIRRSFGFFGLMLNATDTTFQEFVSKMVEGINKLAESTKNTCDLIRSFFEAVFDWVMSKVDAVISKFKEMVNPFANFLNTKVAEGAARIGNVTPISYTETGVDSISAVQALPGASFMGSRTTDTRVTVGTVNITAADGTDAANQFMGGIEDRAAAWTANADGAY
jgi:hypothetical protein